MSKLPLEREEYIEQAYFFRVLRERIEDSTPIQEVLTGLREEVLSTTKLPLAIDFLVGELQLKGRICDGLTRLSHYFTSFQAFIIERAEEEESRFDFRMALRVLEHEAAFRSSETFDLAGLFIYQFECIARNGLGYDFGLLAVGNDPVYTENWRRWIKRIRFDLGTVDFADLVYHQSLQYVVDTQKLRRELPAGLSESMLFDEQAGRIAKANLKKDPLYMFAALQRQLGYPSVPRPKPLRTKPLFDPQVEQRFQRLESKLSLLEQEQRGGLDLTRFYKSKSSSHQDQQEDMP